MELAKLKTEYEAARNCYYLAIASEAYVQALESRVAELEGRDQAQEWRAAWHLSGSIIGPIVKTQAEAERLLNGNPYVKGNNAGVEFRTPAGPWMKHAASVSCILQTPNPQAPLDGGTKGQYPHG